MTSSGAVTSGVWSTFSDRIRASMRLAINNSVAGLIIRSSSAMRYQDGFVFHAGLGAFS